MEMNKYEEIINEEIIERERILDKEIEEEKEKNERI